ncbi:MAG: pitrilysin family protein [Candidatus Zixiibacteriota bacterium]
MKLKKSKSVWINLILLSFIVFILWGGMVTASAQEIKLPPIKKTMLDNGLKVIVIEQHELPLVAFRLILKSGTACDPSGKAGLADLTAGLLRKGTKTRSATQVAEEIDFIGGSLDAGADRDATFASSRVLAKYFDTGLGLLSDIMLNPTFQEEEIDRLKKQTLASIKQQKDDPGNVAGEKFREFVFGDNSYGLPTEGTEESITTLTRDDIVNFHKKYYVPSNAVLAVVGDVKNADVIKKVKAKFSSWSGTPITLPTLIEPPAIKGYQILLVDKPDLTQTYIELGHLGIDRKNPDIFAVRVMNYILGGGGFASRLMDEVRAKRGLTYGIYSSYDYLKWRGAFNVSTFTQNDSTTAAITAIIDQLKKIRSEGVTDKELADTKSFYTGYFPLQFETPEQIATQILVVELYDLGEDYITNYTKYINAVTQADIQRVAQKYIDPDNLKMVVVSRADQVKLSLEQLGTVEVTSFLK